MMFLFRHLGLTCSDIIPPNPIISNRHPTHPVVRMRTTRLKAMTILHSHNIGCMTWIFHFLYRILNDFIKILQIVIKTRRNHKRPY